MKTKAVLMALAMMTTALAGCTSGTDGVPEVDEDALNELIQDNLQDFINNTTVVVNQDFHYHNNTTVVNNHYDTTNEYNNTTNIDGGEVNNYETDNSNTNYTLGGGASGSSIMQMFTVSWGVGSGDYVDLAEKIVLGVPNSGNSSQDNGSSSGDSGGNGDSSLLYVTYYNNNVIEFRSLTCAEWMHYYQFDRDGWEDWLYDNYGSGNNLYAISESIFDHFRNNDGADQGYGANSQCPTSYEESEPVILFEINLQEGEAISFLNSWEDVLVDINCEDGFGTGLGNGTWGYLGGQAECTVTGTTTFRVNLAYTYERDDEGNYVWNQYYYYDSANRIYYTNIAYDTPEEFAVYFTMHYVEIYDLGNE